MNSHMVAFVVIALVGLGVMGYSVHDSGVTGKAVDISKIRPETVKKVAESDSRPLYTVPKETLKKVVPQPTTSYSMECEQCPNPYEGAILTKEEAFLLPGLSGIDCALWFQIKKLKQELGKPYKGNDMIEDICKAKNWWPSQ